MQCSICNKDIPVKDGGWSEGNNAQPVNDGRCCDECNMAVVVPARLHAALNRQDEEEEEYWLYLINHKGYCRVVGEDDNWDVAHQMTGETGRLFAAATDLLAALKACRKQLAEWVDEGSDDVNDFDAVKAADAAINKAEGRVN